MGGKLKSFYKVFNGAPWKNNFLKGQKKLKELKFTAHTQDNYQSLKKTFIMNRLNII